MCRGRTLRGASGRTAETESGSPHTSSVQASLLPVTSPARRTCGSRALFSAVSEGQGEAQRQRPLCAVARKTSLPLVSAKGQGHCEAGVWGRRPR